MPFALEYENDGVGEEMLSSKESDQDAKINRLNTSGTRKHN